MDLSMCVRRCDDQALVSIEGEADLNSAPWLRQRLMHLLEGNGPHLLVDLSGVTFIDCFATRLLAETCRRAGERSCSIQFVALSKPVERLAELTGLTGELPLAAPSRRPSRPLERERDDGIGCAADPQPHHSGHDHPARGNGILRLPAIR